MIWSYIGLVSSGAMFGALSRYGVTSLAKPLNQRFTLPLATLAINLIGACLLGWDLTSSLPATWQLFLGTGLMGGLTTFSTMINEIIVLAQHHRFKTALIYLVLSLVGGLLMVWIGTRL